MPTDEFMSIVAHDLRNPVSVMRASAQMARRQLARGDTEAAYRRLDAIVEQTGRVADMLEAFQEAARVEAGTLPLRLERVELKDVVSAAIERARSAVGPSGERVLEVRVAEGYVGMWDAARVGRAVRALLENALLYGAAGAPVRVWAMQRDGRARLAVSGGGDGPTAEEAGRLFERFFRGHAAAESGHAGPGLGLYIARGIARALGGDVRRSPDGPPDAFEVELPVLNAATPPNGTVHDA